MKKYVCTVCGYVHNGELPDDFVCPVCGAGKGAFKEVVEGAAADVIEKPQNTLDKELSAMEMSIICSNLARGCEKQYMPAEAEKFASLGEFFRKKAGNAEEKGRSNRSVAHSYRRKSQSRTDSGYVARGLSRSGRAVVKTYGRGSGSGKRIYDTAKSERKTIFGKNKGLSRSSEKNCGRVARID